MDKVVEFFNSSEFTFSMCNLAGSLFYLDNHRYRPESQHIGTAIGVGVLTGLGGIVFREALPESKHMVGVGAACIVGQSLYNTYDRWRYWRNLRNRSDEQVVRGENVEDFQFKSDSTPDSTSDSVSEEKPPSEPSSESTSNSDNESNSESSEEE